MSFVKIQGQQDVPITLAEAKLQLRSYDTTEDSLIISKINAVTNAFEYVTNRCLMQQIWEWRGSDWPGLMFSPLSTNFTWPPFDVLVDREGYMRLRPGPLVQVNSIKYWTNNAQNTLSNAAYMVDTGSVPGRISFTSSAILPPLDTRPDAVAINFTAGYGNPGDSTTAQQAAIPDDIKEYLRMKVGTHYENRQTVMAGTRIDNMEFLTDKILEPYILTF